MLIATHNINKVSDIVTRHPEISIDINPDTSWEYARYRWGNKNCIGVVDVFDVTITCETFECIVHHTDSGDQLVFGEYPLVWIAGNRKTTYITQDGRDLSKSQLTDNQKSIAKTLFDIHEMRYFDGKVYMMSPKFLTLNYIAGCRYLRRHGETPLDYLKATKPYVQRAVSPEDYDYARLLIQHHKALDPQPDPEDIRRHELIRRETLGLIDLKLIGDLTL